MRPFHSVQAAGWMLLVCLTALVFSWNVMSSPPRLPVRTVRSPPRADKMFADGLENLWKLPLGNDGVLYSGGQPEGDAGFAALRALGIRTVISVDGARPDIETAKHYGLRYVHLPISYDDVPVDQLARMAQAVRSLPGPAYVHCHHGKHRGPASAVSIGRCLNPDLTPAAATQLLQEMGTAAKYRGLYRAVERKTPSLPTTTAIDLPEVTPAAPLAEYMVAIDLTWEEIVKLAKTPAPTPAEFAKLDEQWTNLVEHFRESARLFPAGSGEKQRRLHELLNDSAAMLVSDETFDSDAAVWEWRRSRLPQIEANCTACHAEFRD